MKKRLIYEAKAIEPNVPFLLRLRLISNKNKYKMIQ